MRHWGTCPPPPTSNCLIFQVTSEPHKLWHSTPYGCLSSKNCFLSFVPPPLAPNPGDACALRKGLSTRLQGFTVFCVLLWNRFSGLCCAYGSSRITPQYVLIVAYRYVCDRISVYRVNVTFRYCLSLFCEFAVFCRRMCINITGRTKAYCVCNIYTPRVSLLFRMLLFAQYVARCFSVGALSTGSLWVAAFMLSTGSAYCTTHNRSTHGQRTALDEKIARKTGDYRLTWSVTCWVLDLMAAKQRVAVA